MSDADRVFSGSIPELYERLMVPMIFDPYAADMARRVAGLKPSNVLETAAGTGALTRALVKRLPPKARIVATDLNQPMIEIGKSGLSDAAHVEWLQADALSLPFDDASFDSVACQFGVMFFPDKVKGYREARRVLRRGGSFLFNAWDRLSENAFVAVVSETLARLFPNDPPSFMERTPHGYFDEAVMRRELREAGFGNVAIETVSETSKAASARDAATAYCQGTPVRAEIEARAPGRLGEITEAVAHDLRRAFGEGPVEGAIRARVVTASG